MKVLQLLSSTGLFGAENVVLELAAGLRDRRESTSLGVFETRDGAHEEIIGEAKKVLDDVELIPCKGKFDIRTVAHLRRMVSSRGISIIHSHKYKTNLYSMIATASKDTGLVATCHNWLSRNYKLKFYEALDKRVLNRFDAVVAVSDEVRDKIARAGIVDEKIFKIKNGVNIERYSKCVRGDEIRKELKLPPENLVVTYTGRLDDNKGIDLLLRAASDVLRASRNVTLLIVGDGPSIGALRSLVEDLDIMGRVVFTGFRNDIPEIFSGTDIFVLPSLKEGLPMVILEAMASGKPVIATRVGDLPDVIEDGSSGLLVKAGDIEGLERALRRMIDDKGLRERFSSRAFEKVSTEYSSTSMTDDYIKIYEQVQNKYRPKDSIRAGA